MLYSCQRFSAALLLFLCACSTTVPVTVLEKGHVLKGTATTNAKGGSFQVSDASVTCTGAYYVSGTAKATVMPVHCSDGRKALVAAIRQADGTDRFCRIALKGGKDASLVFPQSAPHRN